MNAPVLVCGSIAEDVIGGTTATGGPGIRSDGDGHPALVLDSLVRRWGGCALNISAALAQLGVPPVPVATVGADYRERLQPYLQGLGLSEAGVFRDDRFAVQATAIMIDPPDAPQQTFFHAGPSDSDAHRRLTALPGARDAAFVHVAPLAPETALRHLRDARELGISAVFDPGQCLSRFDRDQLAEALDLTTRLTLNQAEWRLLARLGWPEHRLRRVVDIVVITDSAEAVRVLGRDADLLVRPPPTTVTDETGCGDAFRAGYLSGLVEHLDERAAIERACCLGALCAETVGGHHYAVDRTWLNAAREHAYGVSP